MGSAFLTGLLGGLWVNATEKPDAAPDGASLESLLEAPREDGSRLLLALRYAVFELLAAIDVYLILGVLAAALISLLLPPGALAQMSIAQGFGGMLLVLVLSMALYVCTTSSVPIAAALIAAGLPTGTALVFLMAGPATNVATIGLVYRALGLRVVAIYLATVAISSVVLGSLFDWVLPPAIGAHAAHWGHVHEVAWWELGAALLLLAFLGLLLGRRAWARLAPRKVPHAAQAAETSPAVALFVVGGLSCGHCVARVVTAAKALDGVSAATLDLASGELRVTTTPAFAEQGLRAAVEGLGYTLRKP